MSKVRVSLKSAGDCAQISLVFAASREQSVAKIIDVIRKQLRLPGTQSVFLFYKEFAIYPDMTIGDIVDHTPEATAIDIYYSLAQSYG